MFSINDLEKLDKNGFNNDEKNVVAHTVEHLRLSVTDSAVLINNVGGVYNATIVSPGQQHGDAIHVSSYGSADGLLRAIPYVNLPS